MEEKKAYAQREKVYMNGTLYPFIKVGMQKVNLTPTVEIVDGEKVIKPNAPVFIYDTGGPYTDKSISTDPHKGIERIFRIQSVHNPTVVQRPGWAAG